MVHMTLQDAISERRVNRNVNNDERVTKLYEKDLKERNKLKNVAYLKTGLLLEEEESNRQQRTKQSYDVGEQNYQD